MKKSVFQKGGPFLLAGGWIVWAAGQWWHMVRETPGEGVSSWGAGLLLAGGATVLMGGAVRSLRRGATSLHAKINIWSSGRPGEVLVGVLSTGIAETDPAGLVMHLDCVEVNSAGRWLLWTSQVRSPTPTGPDAWPFHFSIPTEGPPSGPSTDGEVVWQLRAHGASRPIFDAVFDVPVARVKGPPSHLLPVPPPAFRKSPGARRRSVSVIEKSDQTVLRLDPRFAFPGPQPVVIWTLQWVGLLMILIRRKAPLWTYCLLGGANVVGAVLGALLWFGREELSVVGDKIVFRRLLWSMGPTRRFPKSAVTGVRVAFSGPPPHFGVRIERGDARPLAVFDGFTDSLDAHEAARSVLRALSFKK
jgi:hypothetical protein